MAANIKTLLCFGSLLSTALALPQSRRDTEASSVKEQKYDYIIVGGGLTGLVVANRLSELRDRTVLVIENGYIDDSLTTKVPNLANSLNSADMYSITSAPDPNLGNATYPVQVGNVVGGGSVVNGMAFDRASAADYDAWEELGNPGWGWDSLLYYFKKSTTFTPPLKSLAKEFGMTYDENYYGKTGPLQASYPPFDFPDTKTIWSSFRAEKITFPKEGGSGDGVGAYWIPTALDPKTMTRSHARTAYYDPVKTRSNLKLVTGQTVNEILFNGLTATGVQFVSRADKTVTKAYAKREVIMAAGGVFTPQLLQLSGLGPKSVLQAAGVKVKRDMPSIGANFQDHANVQMFYNLDNMSFPNPLSLSTNATYNASAWQEYLTKKTGQYTIAHGNSLAFLSLPQLTTNYKTIVNQLKGQKTADFLPPIYSNKALLKGFEAQKSIITDMLSGNDAAAGEIPMSPFGLAISALQRPLSRGTIQLNPKDKYGNPVITFNTFQNPVDKAIIMAMIKFTRNHWARKELAGFAPLELVPGATAQTDDQIIKALVASGAILPTFAHPACTCAMMPEDKGGVVGSDLLVYGVDNLSVVDASILPLLPATHIQATMYAVAEKAADLIKARG
ncbi:alcohol oxidase [Lindgomyces ingoldianus]|uniref:Alcohol oxidase n=1 Tax=Lindgomyces ingoldianus TaxID=673940 RepID=A0ACB6R3L9_9PLEO|nr:alcohol oxidase [Lindgomyces ingoldianus]KAF2473380.1 alcohol oxidase [Lindgomyces ingoldianus]